MGLAPISHPVIVTKQGYRQLRRFTLRVNSWIRVRLDEGSDPPAVTDEFAGGYIVNRPGDASVLTRVNFSSLQPKPPFLVAQVGRDVVELHSLWRVRMGNLTQGAIQYTVPTDELPSSIATGQIFEFIDGAWEILRGRNINKWRASFRDSRLPALLDTLRRG